VLTSVYKLVEFVQQTMKWVDTQVTVI